jgi:multisubunit Na+/H+ antiporter MnhE subunit
MTGPHLTGRFAYLRRGKSPRVTALIARRIGSWLVWWVLMMSFWVMLDDSIATDELLAGAGAAALAAFFAELVTYQAQARFRMRIEWLVPALRLPGQLARDTVIVYAALWRRLARGEQPPSAFVELPVRYGDDSMEGATRRALLMGGTSVAPNTFVLGIDADRDVMVVHRLVAGRDEAGTHEAVKEKAGRHMTW